MQVYKQKVKHMLYEHQNELNSLKVEASKADLKAAEVQELKLKAMADEITGLKEQFRQKVPKGLAPHCLVFTMSFV